MQRYNSIIVYIGTLFFWDKTDLSLFLSLQEAATRVKKSHFRVFRSKSSFFRPKTKSEATYLLPQQGLALRKDVRTRSFHYRYVKIFNISPPRQAVHPRRAHAVLVPQSTLAVHRAMSTYVYHEVINIGGRQHEGTALDYPRSVHSASVWTAVHTLASSLK